MKKYLIPIIIIFVFLGCSRNNGPSYFTPISYNEVYDIIINNDEKFCIIDVRDEAGFNAGHLRGAIHVDVENLVDYLKTSDLCKNKNIIIYCFIGYRSSHAIRILNNAGYRNIFLMGGITNWTHQDVIERN